MDQVWKGLSNLDPHDPGGFYKKPPLIPYYLEENIKNVPSYINHNR